MYRIALICSVLLGADGASSCRCVEMRSCLFALFLLHTDFSHVICAKHLTQLISRIFFLHAKICNKAFFIWSCACTAASVAMVIYAHSPRPNKPPSRGSYQDLLETENSAMESQLTAAPKTSIVIEYITLQMPQSCSHASWVRKRWGLVIINQSVSPYCFLPLCCRAFQCRCTMTSLSNPIKVFELRALLTGLSLHKHCWEQ